MIMSIVVIFIVLALAYIWASRGFFSALLHMACVLVAGGIAFGLWEPIAYFLREKGGSGFLVSTSFALGLGLPFALSLAVIRLIVDKLVPANADMEPAVNLVGGGICGLVSGTITAGIFVLSLSFLPLPPSVLDYQPVKQNTNGAPVIQSSLLFPADKITAGLYGYTAEAAFRTDTPLLKYRPSVTVDGALMRSTFNEGGAKHTLGTRAFNLTNRFTVGKEATDLKVSDLLKDGFATGNPKAYDQKDSEFSPGSTGYYIEGFVVSFGSAAREKEGAVVIGNTQIELVVYNEAEGTSMSLHPVAVSSKAENDNAEDKKIYYGRWRFERPDTYVRSVGGTDNALMAFEFLVPKGSTPLALYVKGVREDITRVSEPAEEYRYKNIQERDEAIGSGTALKGEPGAPPLLVYADADTKVPVINPEEGDIYSRPVNISNVLPPNKTTQVIINKDNLGALKVNDDKHIVSGEEKFRLSDLQKNRGIDSKLQIRQFFDGEDTKIVQINFGATSPLSPVKGPASQASGEMVLVDNRGERYPCVGFVYYDNQLAHIRFTPEAPVRTKDDLPSGGPSTSRPDQQFILLFRVARNAKVNSMEIGATKVAEVKPELTVK